MSVHALVDATPACGGKALGLARLIAAGLPVPDGFVIDDAEFRDIAGAIDLTDESAIGHVLAIAAERIGHAEIAAPLAHEVGDRVRALGGPLAVRSSATIEDAEAGSAAGVFSSTSVVRTEDIWPAVRAVWASALTPLAAAYARHRSAAISIGVIVERHVQGEHVTIYTRPPGAPTGETAMIQRGDQLAPLARSSSDPILALALRAEAAIGATAGADVELVVGTTTWIVQARPIIHPRRHLQIAAPPSVTAALEADGRAWKLDITHNPDPLSPAQSGLVERLECAAIGPAAMRVCGGYLYATARGPAEAVPPPATRTELLARAAVIEARLAEAIGEDVPPLATALARYLAFYAIWAGELSPLIASARAGLTPRLLAGARPSAVEATLLAAGRDELDEASVLERLGVLAPAWDVAVPTYGERPHLLRRAILRARGIVAPAPTVAEDLASTAAEDLASTAAEDLASTAADDLASAAADLAERDDFWFARAQLLIRRAIQLRADELGVDRDAAFWIPLEQLLAGALDPDEVRRRASGARNAAARAEKWAMPRFVGGPAAMPGRSLHGAGTGPRVTGRIVRFATLASTVTVGSGDVVVTRAVTPALAVQVIGCAALVSESGGLLDHGAALARELGIPCVVGCHDAWTLLADGMVVTVDGDKGSVEIST